MKLAVVIVALLSATAIADPAPGGARDACTAAMNQDPTFARDIVNVALNREAITPSALCASADTMKTHLDAAEHVAKNERHVILAYAAMWVIAAGFLAFLWWRQQKLRAEIAQLRRELDEAAKETAKEATK